MEAELECFVKRNEAFATLQRVDEMYDREEQPARGQTGIAEDVERNPLKFIITGNPMPEKLEQVSTGEARV